MPGHFVKMVHNGIEYGIMAAYAEGLNILQQRERRRTIADTDAETTPLREPEYYQYDIDIAASPRCGGAAASIAVVAAGPDRAALADARPRRLHGRVSDSGEGRWTVHRGRRGGRAADVLTAALFDALRSRGEHHFANQLLSAMRLQFGGHAEKPAGEASISS